MWLRIFLFAGLVLHKIIWEILKRKRNHDVNRVAQQSGADVSSAELCGRDARTTSIAWLNVRGIRGGAFEVVRFH